MRHLGPLWLATSLAPDGQDKHYLNEKREPSARFLVKSLSGNAASSMKSLRPLKPVTPLDVFDYLQDGIDSFTEEPADCDFQRGYQRALFDMRENFFGVSADERLQ